MSVDITKEDVVLADDPMDDCYAIRAGFQITLILEARARKQAREEINAILGITSDDHFVLDPNIET